MRGKYEKSSYNTDIPAALPRQLTVSQRVTARHPVTRQLHDGDILTIAPDCYRYASRSGVGEADKLATNIAVYLAAGFWGKGGAHGWISCMQRKLWSEMVQGITIGMCCRVQFDRRELGVELVKDVDVMPIDPTDNLPSIFAPMMVRVSGATSSLLLVAWQTCQEGFPNPCCTVYICTS